jgi:hypothetical protein
MTEGLELIFYKIIEIILILDDYCPSIYYFCSEFRINIKNKPAFAILYIIIYYLPKLIFDDYVV